MTQTKTYDSQNQPKLTIHSMDFKVSLNRNESLKLKLFIKSSGFRHKNGEKISIEKKHANGEIDRRRDSPRLTVSLAFLIFFLFSSPILHKKHRLNWSYLTKVRNISARPISIVVLFTGCVKYSSIFTCSTIDEHCLDDMLSQMHCVYN